MTIDPRLQVTSTIFDGIRSALFLSPRQGAFDMPLRGIVALCLLSLLADTGFHYLLSNGYGTFEPDGLSHAIAVLAITIAVVSLLPRWWGGEFPMRLFNGLTATSIAITALTIALGLSVRWLVSAHHPQYALLATSILALLALVWFVAALFRLGYGLADRRHLSAGFTAVIAMLLAVYSIPQTPIFGSPYQGTQEFSLLSLAVRSLHTPTPPSQPDKRPRLDYEATIYRQHEMMQQALATLEPPRSDRPEFYTVVMAPYASQEVFQREAKSVRAIFEDRLDARGHSLTLLNHRDSVNDLPLASHTNLDTALRHIGKLMRPDIDVLALYITTHGSPGYLAVQFPGFSLNSLTPERLTASLDAAGIKNRVIILSACHSGSFIAKMKSSTTLIMTAAHEERTSFGCSDENEWTYFGDALLNRALRETNSFPEAFAKAKGLIADWEKRDGIEASDPQIFIGEDIEARLAAITAHLSQRPAPALDDGADSSRVARPEKAARLEH